MPHGLSPGFLTRALPSGDDATNSAQRRYSSGPRKRVVPESCITLPRHDRRATPNRRRDPVPTLGTLLERAGQVTGGEEKERCARRAARA